MIDLHSHTDCSDGTASPAELVGLAVAAGLESLAITDHDTFDGYDAAAPLAREAGLDLVCGIELSTEFHDRVVHLLAYWPNEPAGAGFRAYLTGLQQDRHERNRRQIAKLRELGVIISLEEAQAYNPNMTGRPHFARVLVDKGYASSIDDAFKRYLGEHAPGYVPRHTPQIDAALRTIAANGGIASLAHPIRMHSRDRQQERARVAELVSAGLPAIEVAHSDHRPSDVHRYEQYAKEFGLLCTGGSDFHGEVKPDIQLGRGRGGLHVPGAWLEQLRLTAA